MKKKLKSEHKPRSGRPRGEPKRTVTVRLSLDAYTALSSGESPSTVAAEVIENWAVKKKSESR